MKLIVAGTACILLASFSAAAQNDKSDWPEGSAMHTGFVFAEQLDEAQAALEQRHRRLVELATEYSSDYMGTRIPSAIEAEHAAWLAYREAGCELFGAATGAGGTWPSTHALGCEVDLTTRRLETVTNAVQCIEAEPEGERDLGLYSCLEPLQPPVPGIGEA